MPNQLQQVQPGDLITADLLNTMITIVNTLDQRVTVLEETPSTGTQGPPTQKVTITRLDPPDEVAVGETLSVYGANFGMLAGAARAFVGNTEVTVFKPGSNDRVLIFVVPNLPDTLPTPLVVTAANQFSTAQRSILVKPRDIELSGPVAFDFPSVTPSDVPAGKTATWTVVLSSGATRAGTFDISAIVSQTAWQPGVKVVASATSETPITTIDLTPLVPKNVFVKVPIPSTDAGAKFRLTVSVKGGSVLASGTTPENTVGQPAETPDSKIKFEAPSADNADFFDAATNTVTLRGDSSEDITISFSAHLYLAGTHDVTITTTSDSPQAWKIQRTQSTPAQLVVTAQQETNGGIDRLLAFYVPAPPSTDVSPATSEIKVQRQGETMSRKLLLNLRARPTS